MANNQLLASDNFASGSLAAGWSAFPTFSVCQVVNLPPHVTEPNATSTQAGQLWTGLAWPSDHSSEVTVQSLVEEGGTILIMNVRIQSGIYSGYQANIDYDSGSNSLGVFLYRFDVGTPTALGNVTGLTSTAGDVWTMQAAGSVISIYQNGARVIFAADSTYKGGAPGYCQYSVTDVTHVQIASWRGYNCIQQDGIWQKQGVVIAPVSADLASSGWGVLPNSAVLHEGGAQLLSGTVFKTWFGAGNDTTGKIYYAESLDGITWTRRSSAVINGYMIPTVLKVSGTYYLYAQAANAQGSGNFQVFTSTDGIVFSAAHDTGIGLGVAAWDDQFIYIFQPVTVISGTWYGLYSGSNSTANADFSVGLATSSNGLDWTKYGSNPVLGPNSAASGGVLNSQAIAEVNGTWYMWCEGTQSGLSTVQKDLNPTQCIRYQTTDFINWTNPVKSISNGQMFEFANGNLVGASAFMTGQSIPTAIVDVNGKAYLYLNCAASNGAMPTIPSMYQVSVAIGPASIASIITANEDGLSAQASDGFTGGAGGLGPKWTVPMGGTALKVVSGNFVEPTALATHCMECYTGVTVSSDQYSQVIIHTLNAGAFVYPTVRNQTGSVGFYEAVIRGASGSAFQQCAIYTNIAGTETQISPFVQITPQVGDALALTVIGNAIALYQNGYLVVQTVDLADTFTSGYPGIHQYATTALSDSQVSDWVGGSANVTPFYPPIGTGAAEFLLVGCGGA